MLWFQTRLAAFTPLILVALLTIVYAVSQASLVECKLATASCKSFPIKKAVRFDGSVVLDSRGAIVDCASHATASDFLTAACDSVRAGHVRTVIRRYTGRIVWAFFIGVSTVFAAMAVALTLILFLLAWERDRRRLRRWLLATAASAGLLGVAMGAYPYAHMSVMYPILQASVDQGSRLGFSGMSGFMSWVNGITYGLALAMVIAVTALLDSSALAQQQFGKGVWREAELNAELQMMARRARYLRAFLYLGAALLVVGVLRMNVVIGWANTFLDDSEAMESLRATLVSTTGGFFSLILAAVYLPTAYLLGRQVDFLIDHADVSSSVRVAARARPDVAVSVTDALPRIAAVLAPLAAGPIGELFKHFAG